MFGFKVGGAVAGLLVIWVAGMRYASKHASALEAFRRAHVLDPSNISAGDNFVAECLELGHADDALRVYVELLEWQPYEPVLFVKYALGLLIAKRLDEAEQAIAAGLSIAPDDPLSREVAGAVLAVKEGRFPQPDRWPPVQGSA